MLAYDSLSGSSVTCKLFFLMGTQIRTAQRAKYKMLSVSLVKIFYQSQASTHTFYSVLFIIMVGLSKMSMVGQSRSLGILFCMPKIKEPMTHFHFSIGTGKAKLMTLLSLVPPETKMSLESLYPTILNLPHPTSLHILVELLLVRIQSLLCCFKSFL